MKKICILIVIILSTGISQLSAYKSIFGNDTTRWHVFEFAADAGLTIDVFSYSDTLIYDPLSKTYLLYHKLYWDYMGYEGDYEHYNTVFGGYVYEDTVTGIWKFMHSGYQKKSYILTLMDMSLTKGDTFNLYRYPPSYLFRMAIVDSVFYINDRKIIEFNWEHFSIKSNVQKFRFIEGIGPSIGFYLGINEGFPENFSLLCKYDNSEMIYSTNDYIDCWHSGYGNIEDKSLDKHIIIYPNPTTEKISIEISDFNAERLSCNVYNVLGQIIQSIPIISNKTELKIEQRGFYYFVITDGKKSQVQKVIIDSE